MEAPPFQKLQENYDPVYDYKDQNQLAKDIPAEFEWYKGYVQRTGMKKE